MRAAHPLLAAFLFAAVACSSAPGLGGSATFDLDALAAQADGLPIPDDLVPKKDASDAASLPGDATLVEPAQPATMLPPGTYASLQHLSLLATVPALGSTTLTYNTTLMLHTVTHEAGKTLVVGRTCDIRQPTTMGVITTFTQAFLDAVPDWKVEATATGPAGGPWKLTIAESVTLLGLTLDDPWHDNIPTDAKDPHIFDGDNDGHPGLTLVFSGLIEGLSYMVQRSRTAFAGTLQADLRMEGLLGGAGIEQKIIGASDDLLASFSIDPQKDPDPTKSTFRFVPAPKISTCAELIAAEAALFP